MPVRPRNNLSNRLRLCILAQPNPFSWVDRYIEAFRERCDVITVGPTPSAETVRKWQMEHLAHLIQPNDIVTDALDVPELLGLLPDGWRPDLLVAIQSGLGPYERIPFACCPTARISVDIWHDSSEYVAGRPFDFVFAAQREFVPLLRSLGVRRPHWLPLACAPGKHFPVAAEKDFDVVFVGACDRPIHRLRADRLNSLAREFSVATLDKVAPEEMSRACARGRLVFNSSISGDVNMRVFEALAMGAALLTNRDADINGLLDLFEDGKHLIAYTDGDLLEKARAYLAEERARQAIASAGRAKVLAKHTYTHRVDELINVIAAEVPTLGRQSGLLVRVGDRLLDWLPVAPGVVLDMGLGLEGSKVALTRMGCSRYVGLTVDPALASRRERSYDQVLIWPQDGGEVSQADTVVLSARGQFGATLRESLAAAWRMLREGGNLLAHVPLGEGIPTTYTALEEWLRAADFHLIALAASPGRNGHIITARKRTRRLADVLAEVYTRHPLPNVSPERIRSQVPEDL